MKSNPFKLLSFSNAGDGKDRSGRKSCFGSIFPDLGQFRLGKRLEGKVFQISVESLGPGHRERKMETNVDEWEKCRQ